MPNPKSKSAIDAAASQLRSIVVASEEGAWLGSEETLIGTLRVSRTTVRQIARLLEREGLLRVRRGLNGGYFAKRPDTHTVELAVSAYLETVHTRPDEIIAMAAVLWVEVLRRAAGIKTADAKVLAQRFSEKVRALDAEAKFDDVYAIEEECRAAIFDLIQSRYIELIFHINTVFARRQFRNPPSQIDDTEAHREFVRAWRVAKLMELEAIADGDPELAVMAARHIRNVWHQRLYRGRTGSDEQSPSP